MKRFADDISNKVATAQQSTDDDKFRLAHNIQAVVRLTRDAESSVARSTLLLRHLLQRVPLRDRSARVCQHVAPMTQLGAGRRTAECDAANWI